MSGPGWTKRFTASGEKLREAVAEYEGLGYEVRLEAFSGPEGCGACSGSGGAMLILTRPAKPEKATPMKIDLHCHTVFSGDSHLEPSELIELARKRGMDAVAITEHMSFDASAPAEKASVLEGFPVFRGVEVSTDLGHIVLFGVADDSWNVWGRKHYIPGLELIGRALSLGFMIVSAHPYSRRDQYAAMDRIFEMKGVAAIECANGRCLPEENEAARKAAVSLGLPMTGGSDCHTPDEVAGCFTVFERRVSTLAELMEEVRAGRCRPEIRRLRCEGGGPW